MRAALPAALALVAGASAFAQDAAPRRACLASAELRAAIADHGLIDAGAAIRSALTRVRGDILGARLCRAGEDFIYEIALLRSDGRVVHVYVDAANGNVVGSRNEG